MSKILKSSVDEWLSISEILYNKYSAVINTYIDTKEILNKLSKLFYEIDVEIDSIYSYDDIEKHNDDLQKLQFMSNGIHYELLESIDTPFSLSIGDLLEKTILLNPSNITYGEKDCMGITIPNTLPDIMCSFIQDDDLKTIFETKCINLNTDELTIKAQHDINEAEFWNKEYEKAELCAEAADVVFTDEIRTNWETFSNEERIAIAECYRNKVSVILGEGTSITDSKITFDDMENGEFGQSKMDGIYLNDDFIYEPRFLYDVDKLIDNITHEMRHQYQECVSQNSMKYGATAGIRNDFDIDNYYKYEESDDGHNDFMTYYTQPMEVDSKAFAALADVN